MKVRAFPHKAYVGRKIEEEIIWKERRKKERMGM